VRGGSLESEKDADRTEKRKPKRGNDPVCAGEDGAISRSPTFEGEIASLHVPKRGVEGKACTTGGEENNLSISGGKSIFTTKKGFFGTKRGIGEKNFGGRRKLRAPVDTLTLMEEGKRTIACSVGRG